eukprot:gene12816-15146_t
MKFGHRIVTEAHKPWAPHYISYKSLKRDLKRVQKEVKAGAYHGTAESAFTTALQAEMVKVSSHYLVVCAEIAVTLDRLEVRANSGNRLVQTRRELKTAVIPKLSSLRQFVVLNYTAGVAFNRKVPKWDLSARVQLPLFTAHRWAASLALTDVQSWVAESVALTT